MNLRQQTFVTECLRHRNAMVALGTPKSFDIYCTTKIRMAAEVKGYREQINKVMSQRPKF